MTEVYNMVRHGKVVAQVVHLASGKCIVSWPTSVIVYDSLQMAQAVHVQHMGGRGEKTTFQALWSDTPSFMRGWNDAMQDDLENCPFSIPTRNYTRTEFGAPSWEGLDKDSWERGYIASCDAAYGLSWRLVMETTVAEQMAARKEGT